MSHTSLTHRRTHNLLLISKLLNQRDTASPFTLVQDTLEQPAKPLLREYLRRARLSKASVVFLSFETFARPQNVDYFLECYGISDRRGAERIAGEVRTVLGGSGSGRNGSKCIILDLA